jgi:Chalcone isomerase-like
VGFPLKRWWPVAVLLLMPVVASSAQVAGIELDEQATVGGRELSLNGAGLRRRVFFNVYVAGLYLTEKRQSAAEVLALAGPKRISITLMRDLSVRKLVDGLTGGVRGNSSPEEHKAVKSRVEEVAAMLLAVQQAREGDVITLDWLPDAGTLVSVNGEVKGLAVPGDDVYRALLGIWLGDHPTSTGLKRALLGRNE